MSHRTRVYLLIASSRGQTMTEYAMILVTVSVIAVALVANAGAIVNGLIGEVRALLSS
jgi:Flp pilus assembly pilin Flp